MAQYKVDFLPADLVVGRGQTDQAISTIEKMINRYASEGYELSQVAQVSVLERPGCLAGIFGAKATSIMYNMLVLRK